MSYEEAALVEPAACALRGLQLSGVGPGSTVLIQVWDRWASSIFSGCVPQEQRH